VPAVPEAPPTEIVFGALDVQGNYRPNSLLNENSTLGLSPHLLRANEEIMAVLHGRVETWRQSVHGQLQSELAEVPRAEGELHLDRMDHYYRALGLPTAPAVVVRSVNDLPRQGFAKPFSEVFYNSPYRSGYYFNIPRLVVAAEQLQQASPHNLEHTIVHEKAHSTGQNTVMVMLSPAGELKAVVVRNGFNILNPIDDRDASTPSDGECAEESQAELFAATYARLFLPREDTMTIRSGDKQLEIDAKYGQKDPRDGITMTSAPLAIALELVIEQDPAILEHLIAARLSVDGLRRFAAGLNTQMPHFYGHLLQGKHSWNANVGVLEDVVDTLYDGDKAVLKKTGGAVLSFVVNKLQIYEQQTGYSFRLPMSTMKPPVLAA
jgi:hypothetical protein